MRLVIDDRPRCDSFGQWGADLIPCDLEKSHKGTHQWARPFSGESFVWTTRSRKVKSE